MVRLIHEVIKLLINVEQGNSRVVDNSLANRLIQNLLSGLRTQQYWLQIACPFNQELALPAN